MRVVIANPPCRIPLANGQEKYFIRAGSRWPFSVVKRRKDCLCDYLPFPFYLAYATALLEQAGFETTALDAIALNRDEDQTLAEIAALRPEIVVIESTTPTFGQDVLFFRRLKQELGCRIVVTGAHVTAFPRESLELSADIDYILAGEYEFSLRQLCDALRTNPANPALDGIPGLGRRRAGEILVPAAKAVIDNLDDLPFPAWRQFPIRGRACWDSYWDNICQLKPAAQMHASRGCPFHCNFCVWNAVMYGQRKVRTFSPARVCDEMEALVREFRVREIYFDDDNFTGSKPHVLALCAEIKRRGLDRTVKWSAMGDIMVCDEPMLAAMADAGCIALKFGVESGDPAILKNICKPVNLDKALRMAARAARLGIKTHATFSVGLLGETRESMQKTLDFAKALDVDTIQISITTPFPGTVFYDQVKEQGLLTSTAWHDFDGQNTSVVRYEHLANEEIRDFAAAFATRWLRHKITRPAWLWRQVKMSLRILRFQGPGGLGRLFRAGWRILMHPKRPS
jgi:anaerobic magnesium-protoporphyrin IX monomethyl ester cyclase